MAGRSAPLNSGHLPVELIESLSQGGGLTDSHEPVGRSEEPADLLSGHDVTPIEPRRAPKEPLARRVALTDALKLHRGNVSHIARHFKTTRSQIHRWLKRFDIDPEQYRG
jgi:transcriptional regulator of acetoin/glycerol metabolism